MVGPQVAADTVLHNKYHLNILSLFSFFFINRFFEFTKNVKGRNWMDAEFGPDLWGRFRNSYADIGDFLDHRPLIRMGTVISRSGGRLAIHPTKSNIYTLCSSLDIVNDTDIDLTYWLGHLLYMYVKEGPGRSRSTDDVVEFLERYNNSNYIVQDVCANSFGWLRLHDDGSTVTAHELYTAPGPAIPLTAAPSMQPRPGLATAPKSVIEYWAGHLFMEYINEQPKKFLKDENLCYFYYRYKTLPKQGSSVAHLVTDSGKRLVTQGNRYRLGSGPYNDLPTARCWLGRAVFEFVFAAPHRKRSEQEVVDRFSDWLTSDLLNNLCWSSVNWLIQIKKRGGGVDIQCGTGDAAYRLSILRASNRSAGTDTHDATDTDANDGVPADVDVGLLHDQDGLISGRSWMEAALEFSLIKLIVDIYSGENQTDRENIRKFLDTTTSVSLSS